MLPLSSHSPEETLSVGAGETPGWEVGLALELGEPEPPQQPARASSRREEIIRYAKVFFMVILLSLM